MVVYLDVLFLFNFLIGVLFLYVIEVAYQEKVSYKRILLGGIVSGFLVIGFLFDYFIYNLFKIVGGVIVAIIGLRSTSIIKTLIKITSFYILNFVCVGFVSSFHIIEWYFFLIVLGLIIIIYFIESNKKMHIFINALKYNVSVSFNHKKLKLEGYLDTGNFSKAGDIPIIYLSSKYLTNHFSSEQYRLVNINTINGVSLCKAYKPNSFIVYDRKKKLEKEVLIVFSNLHDFDCLLNCDLFI